MSESQPQEQGNQPEPRSQVERQRQVEALADEYLERLLAGETPDRQDFLAAHAELADLLGPRLGLVELMHRVARGQRPTDGKTANPALCERVLRVKCPHCGNGIQLVEPAVAEVTCTDCGSSFHVEPGATTSFHSAALPRSIGRFEVIEQLGRGAFGIVYKARDPQLQRLVAVKVPRAGSFATAEEEERFLREARAAAQLNHPGIVPVLEIAHDRDLPYIVSGYVEGLTLADMLTARRPGFRETADLVATVAGALDFAHRSRIIHRDTKPSNLLLDGAGRPHITDFGLARRGEPEITVTLDGQILGTPAYMSPEQAAGDHQHVDARSDVYSLGVVLYELLTGELPFRGNQRMLLHQVIHDEPRPPRSLNDRVPRDSETICLKAMAKTPGRRYASAREMADDLRRFLNREAIRARRVGRAEKLARRVRRNPLVAALTASMALLLLMATGVAISFALYQRQANRELADEKDKVERSQREAEIRAASAAVDLDLKHCEDEVAYGVLRLARTLENLPPHATELRQCVEMNLLAWAQAIRPLGPTFQHDGAETIWELSPDGLTVLTGGADGTARLWDAFTGEVRATLRGHRGKIASIAFSKNGRVAMTVGEDRTVQLWEASNGQARGATAEHLKLIDKALLSPDGGRLLTICHENPYSGPLFTAEDVKGKASLTLWDATTSKRIGELKGHAGQVNDAVFSPDGQILLTGGADGTGRLWSSDSGRALSILRGHNGAVTNVAFSPDGEIAATLICGKYPERKSFIHWWDPKRSMQIAPPCQAEGLASNFRLISRDVAAARYLDIDIGVWVAQYVQGMPERFPIGTSKSIDCWVNDGVLFNSEGTAYDRKSGKPLEIQPGRKYSPDLAQFATDGRFLALADSLVDLLTEKTIGNSGYMPAYHYRHIPDRQTFVSHSGSSLRYVPLSGSLLDKEVAKLFAEVVTCHEFDSAGTTHPLKESEWEEHPRKLVSRLKEHPAPYLIGRVAADRWFWLRRQIDRAMTSEEKIKYLDRLIAVEPSWQNYDRRATEHASAGNLREAALDAVAASLRTSDGFWHKTRSMGDPLPILQRGWELIDRPDSGRSEYEVGLQLAEALSRAVPENRDYGLFHAAALYRVGRYAEALSRLEFRQREWERTIVMRIGEFFLMGPRAFLLFNQFLLIGNYRDPVRALAFLAMTHHRLGQQDRARALLDDLRMLGEMRTRTGYGSTFVLNFTYYQNLLHEAETLIEGKPWPDK